MVWFLIINFVQNVIDCDYYIIRMLYRNYVCITALFWCYLLVILRLLCILQGILIAEKIALLFCSVNWWLTLHVSCYLSCAMRVIRNNICQYLSSLHKWFHIYKPWLFPYSLLIVSFKALTSLLFKTHASII